MKKSGFTVIELLITISIFAILVSIGVPNFKEMIRSSEMSTYSSELVTALNYARVEAVKRGASIHLGQQNAGSWTTGVVVWVDSDDDDNFDSGEELRLWDAFNTGSSVLSTYDSFIFDASGEVNNADVLTLCDSRVGEKGRKINVLASGAIYAEKFDCE